MADQIPNKLEWAQSWVKKMNAQRESGSKGSKK